MKKYIIEFHSREAGKKLWVSQGDETFDKHKDALDRFFKAIEVSRNTADDVSIILWEDNEVIGKFTYNALK
jgi:hypothetical protein